MRSSRFRPWLFVAWLVTIGCQGRGTDATPVAGLPVSAGRVTLADGYETEYELLGTVRGAQATSVGFELAGKVAQSLVAEGDLVKQGDVLATLDVSRLRAQKAELLARRQAVEANVKLATVSQHRTAALLEEQLASAQTNDEATFNLEAQTAELARVQAGLDKLAVSEGQAALKAPFSGTITQRLVTRGSVVAAGEPIYRLVGAEAFEAVVGLPPTLVGEFPVGARVKLTLGASPGYDQGDDGTRGTVSAVVSNVVREIDDSTRSLSLILRFDGSAKPTPGTIVRLEHRQKHASPGAWVPLEALQPAAQGLFRLFRLVPAKNNDRTASDQGFVEAEIVRVLYTKQGRAFVTGTLRKDSLIVVEGAHRVTPGQRVAIVASKSEPEPSQAYSLK